MEEEASPEEEIRDTSRETMETGEDFSQEADSEENLAEDGLTRAPQKETPGSTPRPKDVDKDRCRYCREIGHWERECLQKRKDQGKGEEPKPYGAFSGLSAALPEFYGQAALTMGNPAIGEMYQGITDILNEEECQDTSQEDDYLN